MKQLKQIELFDNDVFTKQKDWQKEWVDMPEYVNNKIIEPEVIATFKFRNQDDFNLFMDVVKTKLYDNKRVFDGKQKKNDYSAWYPLDDRPSDYVYINENDEK